MLDFDEILAAVPGGAQEIPDMFEPLRRLVEDWNRHGNLAPAGEAGKRAGLMRGITNRMRLEQAIAEHPAILDEEIAGPVVIIGLPRSGTTKLHRMLSADPGVQKLLLWQLLNPVPPVPDDRMQIALQFEKTMREQQPELYAAHPMAANEPDEDVFALEVTGRNYINCSTVAAPGYKAWLDAQPFGVVYAWLKRFLQVLQYFERAAGRPWVLKAPQHMGFLPDLFSVFPNATIVHCHRDPAVTIASYAAMIAASRKSSCTVIDEPGIGQYALSFWSGLTRRYLRDRPAFEGRVLDLAYRDVVQNGLACAERIYAAAGIELTAAGRAAMLAWEQANAQHKHGKHRYTLADAGLTQEDVAREFGDYQESKSGFF